jgi:hypothetical protein
MLQPALAQKPVTQSQKPGRWEKAGKVRLARSGAEPREGAPCSGVARVRETVRTARVRRSGGLNTSSSFRRSGTGPASSGRPVASFRIRVLKVRRKIYLKSMGAYRREKEWKSRTIRKT